MEKTLLPCVMLTAGATLFLCLCLCSCPDVAGGTKLSLYTDKKPCTVQYHQMWCSGAQLMRVPPLLDAPTRENLTTYMDLSRNRISRITWELQLYPDLEYLSLENNSLRVLHVDALYHLGHLEELLLSGNKLTGQTFKDESFQSQSNLRILDLSKNLLGPTLSFDIFRYLGSLTCLNLQHNGLVSLTGIQIGSGKLFALNSLTELNLQHNNIVLIPTPIWKLTPNLIVLDMSNNSVVSIISGSFSNLNQLKSLGLSKLTKLHGVDDSAFGGLRRLEVVNLNDCTQLRQIHEQAFKGCQELKHVNLANNSLSTLQQGLLPFPTLQTLCISNNHFTCDCAVEWIPRSRAMNKLIGAEQIECTEPETGRRRELLGLSERKGECPARSGTVSYSGSVDRSQALSGGELLIVVTVSTILVVVSSVAAYLIKQYMMRKQENDHYQYWVLK